MDRKAEEENRAAAQRERDALEQAAMVSSFQEFEGNTRLPHVEMLYGGHVTFFL